MWSSKKKDHGIGALRNMKDSPLSSSEGEPKTRSLQELYKAKKNAKGAVEKYNVRLVAKGYKTKHGIDYEEVFDHVARLETIRMIIAIATQYRWKLYQMDVKSAFLNGLLEEEVYVEQPKGYISKGQEGKVLRLKKALYGLKQAPRAWNTRIDKYFQDHGFRKCLRNSQSMIDEIKKSTTKEFEMKDIGLMSYYLGIEVKQTDEGLFICQERYAKDILKRFGMDKCNPIDTPLEHKAKPSKHDREKKVDSTLFKSLVGSLRYLTCTRPDILFAVGLIIRFMEEPTIKHLEIAKRILRYIKCTIEYGMFYSTSEDLKLVGYNDSDWAGSKDDGRTEYVAATSCVCHTIWLRTMLKELHMEQEDATEIYVDIKSTIDLTKNPVYHDRSKHINTRYHFIQECITRKDIREIHTSSKDQVADIFTKPLNEQDFSRQRMMLGVRKSSLKGGVGSVFLLHLEVPEVVIIDVLGVITIPLPEGLDVLASANRVEGSFKVPRPKFSSMMASMDEAENSQNTEERSARYASTSHAERDTPSRSSRSGDHRRSRRDSPEYDRRESRVVSRRHRLFVSVDQVLTTSLLFGSRQQGATVSRQKRVLKLQVFVQVLATRKGVKGLFWFSFRFRRPRLVRTAGLVVRSSNKGFFLGRLRFVEVLAMKNTSKKKLYTFPMHPSKSRSKHIDEFHKLVGDLAAIDTAISDEDQVLLLLTSLPSSYDNFMETLLYGRDTLKLKDMLATLNSRELQKMTEAKGDGGEELYDIRSRVQIVRSQSHRKEAADSGVIYVSGSGADGITTVVYSGIKAKLYIAGLDKEGFTVKMQSGKIKVIKGSPVSGLSKVLWAEDTTMSTYLVNRSPLSSIGFKTPVDMLGFFGCLASIKKGMLEPVKVKCIFLGYRKGIVGNKLWRLDDVTSKVVLYRNMGFNESGEYKKTFIGSGVGAGSQKVQTQDLMDYHSTRDMERHSARELFKYREGHDFQVDSWKLKDEYGCTRFRDVYVAQQLAERSSDDTYDYLLGVYTSEVEYATKGLLDKAKGNVLGMEIIRDQSGNTLRVSQSRFYNGVGTDFVGGTLHIIVTVMWKRMVSGHVYMRLEARSIRWSARDLT
ncbi:retrovirus-related pol polyprotein from transposon TNT 1-94 [Tanacetum coccineum]